MRIVAGCDGGGSKCAVRIATVEHGGVVRESAGMAGPANVGTDAESAIKEIRLALLSALRAFELESTPQRVAHLVCALAGVSRVTSIEVLHSRMLESLPVDRITIVPDAAILFAAAEVDGAAVASVVGTGSIAWSRTASGEICRAGGLGPDVGDEGSAYWFGKQAITKGISHCAENDSASIAALAAEVFRSTASTAERIVAEGAVHIANLLVEATVSIDTSIDRPLPWVAAGGVAIAQPAWLESIRVECTSRGLFLTKPLPVLEPVVGALRMASSDDTSKPSD